MCGYCDEYFVTEKMKLLREQSLNEEEGYLNDDQLEDREESISRQTSYREQVSVEYNVQDVPNYMYVDPTPSTVQREAHEETVEHHEKVKAFESYVSRYEKSLKARLEEISGFLSKWKNIGSTSPQPNLQEVIEDVTKQQILWENVRKKIKDVKDRSDWANVTDVFTLGEEMWRCYSEVKETTQIALTEQVLKLYYSLVDSLQLYYLFSLKQMFVN